MQRKVSIVPAEKVRVAKHKSHEEGGVEIHNGHAAVDAKYGGEQKAARAQREHGDEYWLSDNEVDFSPGNAADVADKVNTEEENISDTKAGEDEVKAVEVPVALEPVDGVDHDDEDIAHRSKDKEDALKK
ncbi:hypothetical protein NDU88_000334 [Pleurodeles waltl]|uniref:Uncharacterized protein n=1 Tax=Pleurodeles waltl TaxID=8319 RepID=A0AAV7P0J5_PLEWA|nr:hypothetical protein NDU88_000334 [Pleurodeles waltl]